MNLVKLPADASTQNRIFFLIKKVLYNGGVVEDGC